MSEQHTPGFVGFHGHELIFIRIACRYIGLIGINRPTEVATPRHMAYKTRCWRLLRRKGGPYG